MQDAELIVMAGFLAVGGFTFLRLLASARRAAVEQAEAERLALKAHQDEQDKKAREVEIPEAVGAMGPD